VRVLGADGQKLAESPARFNAGREETIDLVIAAPALSEWAVISQAVAPLLIGQDHDGKPQRVENLFQAMQGTKEDPGYYYQILNRGAAQPVIHAESDAMIRAYSAFLQKTGMSPKTMTVIVDRPTCDWCLKDLQEIAKFLGLERVEIFSGGNSVPQIIHPAP